jgi:hypothetical protein
LRALDLSPLSTAMYERPGEFEMDGPWLRHKPSRHAFFIRKGKLARIEARCSCAMLSFAPEQAEEFARALTVWSDRYWRPLQIERDAELRAAEINRQFALHFRPPGRLGWVRMRLADAWHAAWEALTRPDPPPLSLAPLQPELPAVGTAPEREATTRHAVDA